MINKRLKLSNGTSAWGAQMGRANILPENLDTAYKLRMERLRWVDGDYDNFGAYFGGGRGDYVYCAYSEQEYPFRSNWDGSIIADKPHRIEVFVRAKTRGQAKDLVRGLIKAKFYS